MYGLTRATTTLISVAIAGFLMWLGSRIYIDDLELASGGPETWRFWTFMGLLALAGFTMALAQLLGGWTKWGWPRVSGAVFLVGFLPALLLGGWVLTTVQPGENWVARHTRLWSDDVGLESVVAHLGFSTAAIAFAIGLLFGFSFDTTGPRPRRAEPVVDEPREEAPPPEPEDDDRRVRIHEGGTPGAPQPEPEPPPRPADSDG